jgi:hypothetical protein
MKDGQNIITKPEWPIMSIIREEDVGKVCYKCGSSLKYKIWPFIKSKYCIQPECDNYYEKNSKRFRKDKQNKG